MISESYKSAIVRNKNFGVRHLPPKQTQQPFVPPPMLPKPNAQNSAHFNLRKPEPRDTYMATKRNLSIDEYMKRDDMVREAFKDCPFRVGEVVVPAAEKDYQNFGRCRILGVVSCYYDYGDEPWPEGHVPRIINFECDEPTDATKGKHFFGAVHFFARNDNGKLNATC